MREKVHDHLLDIRDLERNYYTTTSEGEKITYSILKGITFQVERGDFIGIMGSSGCGKTTLLKTLGMLDLPNGGSVCYKGVPTDRILGDKLAKVRRTELAFVFQDFYLMDSLTVKENIMMPLILNEDNPKRSEEAAVRAAKQFGIEPLLNKKPYDLSGGEKQRTAICRAMVADPELILADEPTGNLDSNSSMTVIKALSHINKKMEKTIVLVTHDPKVASFCNKIILLKDGVILNTLVKDGENKEFYQKILRQMVKL